MATPPPKNKPPKAGSPSALVPAHKKPHLPQKLVRGASAARGDLPVFPMHTHLQELDLTSIIKISPTLVYVRVLPWALAAAIAAIVLVLLPIYERSWATQGAQVQSLTTGPIRRLITSAFPPLTPLMRLARLDIRVVYFFLRLLLLAPLVAWWYWSQFYGTYSFKVVGFRVVQETGVFFRKVDSRVLHTIDCFVVRRSPFDILFNLYTFQVRMVSGLRASGPKINHQLQFPGLKKRQAFHIEQYFIDFVSRLQSPAPQVLSSNVGTSATAGNDAPDGGGSGDGDAGGAGGDGDGGG